MIEKMTRVEFKVFIYPDNEEEKAFRKKIKEKFDAIPVQWCVEGKKVKTISKVGFKRRVWNSCILKDLQEQLKENPTKSEIAEEYREQYEMGRESIAIISFETKMDMIIDVKNNDIWLPEDTWRFDKRTVGHKRYRKRYQLERLDDFYYDVLSKISLAFVMAVLLTCPQLHVGHTEIWIKGKKYNSENYLTEIFPADTFGEYRRLVKTELSFEETFYWIRNHTSLFGNMKKTPVMFSTLTYIFNRNFHESLIYSTIGLESVYSPGKSGISSALQKRITTFFPSVEKEQIRNIYNLRSKFVHGEMMIGNYNMIDEIVENEIAIEKETLLAIILLLETVRILISQNAEKIDFKESISYSFR